MRRIGSLLGWKRGIAALLLAAGLLLAPGQKAHASAPRYELWLGVLAHDAPIFGSRKEDGPDLNAELEFPSFVPGASVAGVAAPFRWLLRPRPDIGFDANTRGDTSQAYIGLTWTALLARDVWHPGDGLFVAIAVGPELNDGEISTSDPSRKSLGSHVLIHSSAAFGYRIERNLSVALFLGHASDAGLTRKNDGLTNIGIRIGIGF